MPVCFAHCANRWYERSPAVPNPLTSPSQASSPDGSVKKHMNAWRRRLYRESMREIRKNSASVRHSRRCWKLNANLEASSGECFAVSRSQKRMVSHIALAAFRPLAPDLKYYQSELQKN